MTPAFTYCDSCAEDGITRPGPEHSINPDFSGYNLCDDCKREYDARKPLSECEIWV